MAPAPAWLRGVLAATCLKELEAHTDAAARAYYNHIDSRDHASSAARLPRAQLLAAAVRILRLAAAAQRLPHSCAKCALCVLGMVFEGPQDCKTALPLSDSGDLLGEHDRRVRTCGSPQPRRGHTRAAPRPTPQCERCACPPPFPTAACPRACAAAGARRPV
jgi:hypothetical protein